MTETTTTTTWRILWFPSDAPDRKRVFLSEERAREFATTDGVAEWCPLMEKRTVVSTIEVTLVPL